MVSMIQCVIISTLLIVLEVSRIFNTDLRVRQNLKDIQPYQPGLSEEQLRREFGSRTLLKLNSNENALGPSPVALAAIQAELEKLHLYPDGGSDELREAIGRHHEVFAGQVFVGNGSDDIIKLLSETFLDDGDEIVVPTPSFSQYSFGAQVMRANICTVPLRNDFSYDVESVLAAVTEKTKLLYLCTPNNPTGTVLETSAFHWLMERLPSHVFVVVDLAYNNYATTDNQFQLDGKAMQYSNVAYLHTFSKLYGLAGLRVGYALGHEDVWSYVHRVREPFNVNRIAQKGAIAALTDVDHVGRSQSLAAASRLQYGELNARGLRVIASEANFCLVEVGDGLSMFEKLRSKGVLVRAGYPGLSSYVRITFGTERENEQCMEAIVAVR